MEVITSATSVHALHRHNTEPTIAYPGFLSIDRYGSLLPTSHTLGRTPRAIIFDLGDVLFTWSSTTSTSIPPEILRTILESAAWHSYECGHLSQDECYERVAEEFSILAPEVAAAFSQARNSLRANEAMVSFIRELRLFYKDELKIYAMSNISQPDWDFLSTKLEDGAWQALFDRIFTSGHAGMRKPDRRFYEYVLRHIECRPADVIFVDDKEKNVLAAQELGIQSLVFDQTSGVTPRLRERLIVPHLSLIVQDTIAKGRDYLHRHAMDYISRTDTGVEMQENFARLLILEALKDPSLVDLRWGQQRTWNFFKGKPVLIPNGELPDDLDTTALALLILPHEASLTNSVLNDMLSYVNQDGSVQTYYSRAKLRTDPVVSANILTTFNHFDRGHELARALQHIQNVLQDNTYAQKSRYYCSPDICLYFFTRLLNSTQSQTLHTTLDPIIRTRFRERLGSEGTSLDYAMRILCCSTLGLRGFAWELHNLLETQALHGGWEKGWMYCYGSSGIKIENMGVTTALAVKALEGMRRC